MKCPNCGADIKDGSKFCEFCGSSITADMKREQEYVNKAGCPNCGSSNITFNREKQGEVKGKKGSEVVRSTVGMCKDCGHTWHVQAQPVKKRKTWLWVLGWIFIFPLPLTILMLRPTTFPKLDKKIKYGIIAVAWIIYAIWMFGGKGSDKNTTTTDTTPVVETTVEEEPVVETTYVPEPVVVNDVNYTVAENLVEYAKQFVGYPYVYGGNSLTNGTDCSGFTKLIYAQYGIDLPRVAYDQSYVGVEVPISNIQIGDLVLSGYSGKTHHVAIYIGNGQFVAAPQPGQNVDVENVSNYFMPSFIGRVVA